MGCVQTLVVGAQLPCVCTAGWCWLPGLLAVKPVHECCRYWWARLVPSQMSRRRPSYVLWAYWWVGLASTLLSVRLCLNSCGHGSVWGPDPWSSSCFGEVPVLAEVTHWMGYGGGHYGGLPVLPEPTFWVWRSKSCISQKGLVSWG